MNYKELRSRIDGELIAEWCGEQLIVHTVSMTAEEDRLDFARFIAKGPVEHIVYAITTHFEREPTAVYMDAGTGDEEDDEQVAFEVVELWEV